MGTALRRQPRTAAAVRAGLGALMAARPDVAARLLGARRRDTHPVLRVLGTRHLVEAAALLLRPTPGTAAVGMAIDATHVLSCVGFAAVSPVHRRPALRDGAVASAVLLSTWLTRPRQSVDTHSARLAPPVLDAPPSGARLVLITGGRVPSESLAARGVEAFISLPAGAVTVVGRARDADVTLRDSAVSPRHLELTSDGAGHTRLHHLGSENGTRVNGIPVVTADLHDGDRIDLGTSALVYRCDVGDELAQR